MPNVTPPRAPLAPRSGRRTYILDTNVLIYDPSALMVFDEHDLVLPIVVIEELDRFKRELTDRGRAARSFSRELDRLRALGSLSQGVPLPGGGLLRVDLGDPSDSQRLFAGAGESADNIILHSVLKLHRQAEPGMVIFVSRDVNMRLKADALGVVAEDFEHAHVSLEESYQGYVERSVPAEVVNETYQTGGYPDAGQDLFPNQFVILKNEQNPSQAALTRFSKEQGRLVLVNRPKDGAWGIFPKNREQLLAMDLLLDDSIPLVTIDGMAGTGKTLLAIACGLKRVADEKRYRRLVVARPVLPMGKDIGYLPGSVEEKMNPWMKPLFDTLDFLLGIEEGAAEKGARPSKTPVSGWQHLVDQKIIEIEPLSYIRGRSLPKQFLIVDEAQNLSPHEVKTVITRAGEGTKVVLSGDRYQIDNPYVDATSNGLSYVLERFKGSPLAGHITLRKGERSQLAECAAGLL